MDLEWALYELTKQPQSVICKDGHAHPAIRYTNRTRDALNWLVARYNDGTLKVEGYVPKRTPHCKRPPNRKNKEIVNGEFMILFEFMRKSGFSRKDTLNIAQRAGAYIPPPKHGAHAFINVVKFYDYLDHESEIIRQNTIIDITEACRLSGLSKKVIKEKIEDGTIETKIFFTKSANGGNTYEIKRYSLLLFLQELEKGAKNGKDNTNDGEVCGE